MKFACAFIVAAFLVTLSYQATPVKKCADGHAPLQVRVDGCEKTPCQLKRGTDVTAEWDFIVPADTKVLKPRVRATALGITVNYPFPQKDACTTLSNAKCPLDANEKVTYKLSMPIAKAYPRVSVTIEFAFLDDDDDVAVCFVLPATVVD